MAHRFSEPEGHPEAAQMREALSEPSKSGSQVSKIDQHMEGTPEGRDGQAPQSLNALFTSSPEATDANGPCLTTNLGPERQSRLREPVAIREERRVRSMASFHTDEVDKLLGLWTNLSPSEFVHLRILLCMSPLYT